MIAFFTHAFVSPTSSAFFALFSCQFLHLLCQQSSNQFTWHINCEICTSTKTHHTAKKQSFQYLVNAGCEHLLYFLQLRIEYHLLIGMTQSMAILSRVASELSIMRMNQISSECIELILYDYNFRCRAKTFFFYNISLLSQDKQKPITAKKRKSGELCGRNRFVVVAFVVIHDNYIKHSSRL